MKRLFMTLRRVGRMFAQTILCGAIAATIGVIALLVTSALAQSETVLYSFGPPPDGDIPSSRVIQDAAGNLYGATGWGGLYNAGTVFELSPQNGAWVEKVLHSFGGPGDGAVPSGLLMDKAGNLFGAANNVVYELTPDGDGNWTETILKTFKAPFSGTSTDLTMDSAGRLYGRGGSGAHSAGLIYRLTLRSQKGRPWIYFVLYSFHPSLNNDGAGPNGDLVFDAAGNLYGATALGGSHKHGTVFELSPAPKQWTEKILYDFQGASDGGEPSGGLIFDAKGNLYGPAISFGGAGGGVVFELSPNGGSWSETVLYSFTGGSDGGGPLGPLALHNGALYGTAEGGGSPNCQYGCGVVFKLSPSGGAWTETVVHSFTGSPDGEGPESGVLFDSSGNLYGTTAIGGIVNSGCIGGTCGVLYQISH